MVSPKIPVKMVKAAFLVLLIKVMFSTSWVMPWNSLVDNLCIMFAIGVMLVKLVRLTLPLRKLIILAFISLFTLYSCVTIGQYELLITLIAIILLINVDLDEYISLMYKAQVMILIVQISISGVWAIMGNRHFYWSVYDSRFRFNGGFEHANVLSCYVLSCMLMFTWMHFKKITKNQFYCMAAVALVTYLLTISRTGLLLNISLLLLIFFTQKKHRLVEKMISPKLSLLFLALTFFIFCAQKLYLAGNGVVILLDKLMTGRIKYAAYAYSRSGVTLLPRYIDYVAEINIPWSAEWNLNTFTFDSLYSFLFVQLGIIWIGIITAILITVFRKADSKLKIFSLFWMVYSLVEVHGLNCFKFFAPILLTTLLSEKGVNDDPDNQDQCDRSCI